MITLTNTQASAVAAAINKERHRMGSPAVGMVLTLLIITDELNQADALSAASSAAREHPMRVIALIARPGKGEAHLDAQITVGGDEGAGELIACRLHGELSKHAGSVAIPLLLPDTPVVVWWPAAAPDSTFLDAIGKHAQRRITDAAMTNTYIQELGIRLDNYSPGDTDMSWTRTTPWRSLLAAALDQPVGDVERVDVYVESGNPSGLLLAGWLHQRLGVPAHVHHANEPGINRVLLTTSMGEVELSRPDGRVAQLQVPNMPPATVALARRSTAELLSEELRRLDPDEMYLEALKGARAIHSAQ